MEALRLIWNDIHKGKNIDLYLTLIISIVVGIIGILGYAQDHIPSLTLAVLALLTFSGLKSRHQTNQLYNKLDIEKSKTVTLDNLFSPRPKGIESKLLGAKSICHNGISLVGTSNSRLGLLSKCLENGGKVQLILLDPESQALEVAAKRFHKHQDCRRLKKEVEHALDNFKSLHTSNHDNFKIHLMSSVPPYSIWLIDDNEPTAEIFVGLYPYRDDYEPWLRLFPYKDTDMYEFFRNQFRLMWDYSEELSKGK
jgi:hypothetical protein